jgi:hypothetical protein
MVGQLCSILPSDMRVNEDSTHPHYLILYGCLHRKMIIRKRQNCLAEASNHRPKMDVM